MIETFKRKIPENMRPWVCVINGVRYTYEAGTEQYVPDEVAVLIDKYWAEQETDYPETGISFNDLRDRPFGESTEVLFDQRVEIDAENGNFEECELPFSPGDLVKVTWDGVEYKCTVELYEGNVFLGNPDFVDNGTSNGIPFAMLNGAFDGQYYLAIIAPDYGGQSVSIKIEGNVIHPIAPKYLPEGVGGGGVVEIPITWNDEQDDFTVGKTFAEMREAIDSGSTVVLKDNVGFVYHLQDDEGAYLEFRGFYTSMSNSMVAKTFSFDIDGYEAYYAEEIATTKLDHFIHSGGGK